MADEKGPVKAAKAEPAPPVLGVAAESSDPAVHVLLADRETAVLNGDAEAVEAVNVKLADLGVR